MAGLEERTGMLEVRVDELTGELRQVSSVAAGASRDAQMALAAHRHNTRLLNALRETQAEQGRVLDEHSRILDEHTASFARLTVGMHTIESLLRRALE